MIIALDGTVRIEGEEPEVFADTAQILSVIFETLKREKSEQYAMEQLVEIGKIAVMDAEDWQRYKKEKGFES